MKVGILHLSDIHIESADDWICSKAEKIAQAVLGTWEQLHIIFVVISGDVANKGYVKQYLVAHDFLIRIKDYLQQQSDVKVIFIIAPGNHDCDFSEGKLDLKARKAFIDTVVRDPSDIERGDSIYKGCLSVQKHFFTFIKDLDPQNKYPTEPEIFYNIELSFDSHTFYFNVFNTAWLSQKQEDQGALVFPTHLINCETEKLSKGAFSASVFHHPENWLDSNNAIEFRRITEQNSDIILSGHEHHREVFYKRDAESDVEAQIIKAGALQEHNRPDSSSFNLIIVDLENKKQKLFCFKWTKVEYKVSKENEWQDFIRNRFLQKQSFYLLPDFEEYLDSLGSITANSRHRRIALEDFFLAPRLLVLSLKDVIDGKRYSKRIEATKFFDFVHKNKKLIIFGETWQGKTTAAKKVFKYLYERQYATLLVDGSKFNKATKDGFQQVLRDQFPNQYAGGLWDRFLQLPREKRALVIDSFGLSGLSQQFLQKLLQIANEYFEFVVVFAHSDLQLQQYVAAENTPAKLSNYTHCQMLPLDQSQRTQLIRRWVRFNADTTLEEAELIKQENQLRSMVQEAINNGLIASTPFFIFGVLQLIESFKTNPNAQFGSVGYIYQGVITSRLSELGKSPTQINRAFLVISLIAHWLYVNDVNEIEQEDVDRVISDYNKSYRENVRPTRFLDDLQTAQILTKQVTGNWKFVGSHLRDFFVAKYFAQALGEEDSREKEHAQISVKSMIETIVYEPHTRILLFLVYEANSNKKLIRWILNEASKVYGDSEITDLDSDIQFINKLEQSILDQNLLQSGDPRKNQDKQDEAFSHQEDDSDTSLTNKYKKNLVKYSDELDEFTKAAFALKMIELVGQLVKSFAGTIKAELKQDLILECINVGLRFLHSIFTSSKDNLQEIGNILKHLIRQQNPQLTEQNIEYRKDELIIILHGGLGYGVVKKVAQSVGHTDLRDSFADVFETNQLLSHRLVETAIRLDHYAPLAKKLIDFGKEIKDNKFAYNILRRLIADYVNYFDVERGERQKLIDKFKLRGGAEYLINTTKSERTIHLQPRKDGTFSPPVHSRKDANSLPPRKRK
jgi:hypothetical protein